MASQRDPNRSYHDHVAGMYDGMYNTPYWEFYRELTREIIKPHIPRDLAVPVVDLGCGTGVWGLRLAKSGFPVTFVDLSDKMLEQARRKSIEQNLARTEFLQADLQDLSTLPSTHFSFAIAEGDPISLASNPSKALKEIHRILTPGGVLVASLDNACASLEHYCRSHDLPGLEDFLRTGKTPWLARDPNERFPTTTFTPETARRAFARSGFEIITLRGKTILPLRKHPEWLEDRTHWKRLQKIEMKLNKIEAYLGRAGHLLVVARA